MQGMSSPDTAAIPSLPHASPTFSLAGDVCFVNSIGPVAKSYSFIGVNIDIKCS